MLESEGFVRQVPFDSFVQQWNATAEGGTDDPKEWGYRYAARALVNYLELLEEDLPEEEKGEFLVRGRNDLPGNFDALYIHRYVEPAENGNGDTQRSDWYLVLTPHSPALRDLDSLAESLDALYGALTGDGSVGDGFSIPRAAMDRLVKGTRSESSGLRVLVVTDEGQLFEDPAENEDGYRLFEDVTQNFGTVRRDFEIRSYSVKSVYEGLGDSITVSLPLKMKLVNEGERLAIAAVSLYDLYEFLAAHERATHNLTLIYDYNIRQYLKSTSAVNKGIRETLDRSPELFGLYSNGITIAARSLMPGTKRGYYDLESPYIVNGCQTTKTIWEACSARFKKGTDAEAIKEWKAKLKDSYFVVKVTIIGDGEDSEELQNNITRYTNTQNTVQPTDFIALEHNFRTWKDELAKRPGHQLFLEIQRGSFDAHKIRQNDPRYAYNVQRFANEDHVVASEMLRVYAAGWLGMPGSAYNSKKDSLPGGKLYRASIKDREGTSEPFGSDDIYAAARLHQQATRDGFTKYSAFLYYAVFCHLVKELLDDDTPAAVTARVIEAFDDGRDLDVLAATTREVVGTYLTDDINSTHSVAREAKFQVDKVEVHYYFKNLDLSRDESKRDRVGVLMDYLDEVAASLSPDNA